MMAKKDWYSLVAVFVSIFAVVSINIAYTAIAIKRDEQAWCDLVRGLDEQYAQTPPTTDSGKTFAKNIHTIVLKFEC